jgi:hypothetical protein
MGEALILVTPRILVPATPLSPAYYVCTFRNTFEGETVPLSKGMNVMFWGAIPEEERLLSGIVGEVVCHERYWIEVRIEATGASRLGPWYNIRFPISFFHFDTRTNLYRFINYHRLDTRHAKFLEIDRIPPLFRHTITEYFAIKH